MVQIKLFRDHTPDMEKVEKQINTFLREQEGRIVVKDIKYTADYVPPPQFGMAELDGDGHL